MCREPTALESCLIWMSHVWHCIHVSYKWVTSHNWYTSRSRINKSWLRLGCNGHSTPETQPWHQRHSHENTFWITILCNTLQHSATHCNTLQHTATRRKAASSVLNQHTATLQHTATHYNALHHTAAECNTLQHTAAECNTLQHTATHCNTLRRIASHCSTVQHTATRKKWQHRVCPTTQNTAVTPQTQPSEHILDNYWRFPRQSPNRNDQALRDSIRVVSLTPESLFFSVSHLCELLWRRCHKNDSGVKRL